MVFIGEIEITEEEIIGTYQLGSIATMMEVSMTKGSKITETHQISNNLYVKYLVFDDTMNNIFWLQCSCFNI